MKWIMVAVAVSMTLLAGSASRAQDSQRIAAVVNDEVISVYDLVTRIDLVVATTGLQNNAEVRRDIAPQVLQNLINERLQFQEGARLGIQITEDQMARAVASLEDDSGAPSGSFFEFLQTSGLNREAALEQIRAQIVWGTAVRRKLGPNIVVGQEEIDAARERMEAGQNEPIFRIAEIFLGVPNRTDEQAVAADARQLAAQLQAGGVDFGALARQFSQSATAAVGGDLGWVQVGQLAPEIARLVVTMQEGDFSAPIRSVEGFHIVALLERQEPRATATGDVSVELVQVVLPVTGEPGSVAENEQRALAQEVERTVRSCADMRELSKVVGNELSGDLGTMKLDELPNPIRQAVANLAVDQPSAPVRTVNGYHVLMVCARRETGGRVIDDEMIRRDLANRRLDLLARRYLRDLRTASFIEVRV